MYVYFLLCFNTQMYVIVNSSVYWRVMCQCRLTADGLFIILYMINALAWAFRYVYINICVCM